jgi:transcriptional regulator with XRE-family HTH domain
MPHLGNIPDLVNASREQATDGNMQNLAEKLQLSRRTLNAWRLGRQVPQLESLMRLCYFCGVSSFDLLSTQPGELNFVGLKVHSLPNIPNPARNRRNRVQLDIIHLRQSLEAVLVCEEQPPPSMRAVARRLNHSPRELRGHFPELCRAISNRRKMYNKARGEEKLEQQKEQIRQAMLELISQGLYPSSYRVRLLLDKPAIMRNPVLRQTWRDALQELELTDWPP